MKVDLKAKAKSWFTKDKILLYVISFAVAVVLWAAIIYYVNPDTTIVISGVPVKINTSSQDAVSLSIVSGKVETVDVEVTAPRSQVPSLGIDSLTAEIDLTGETKSGTYQKTIEVSSNSEFVKILSVTPSTTTIVLDVTESKTLPIDVDDGGYSAPEGYYIASPSLSVDTVKIIGPKAIVETIEKASVSVSIDDGVTGIVDFKDCEIVFLNSDGGNVDISSVTIDVDSVTVTVPIIRRKTVPLKLDTLNAPGFEGDYCKVDFTPREIEIAAVDDVYDDIESISIGALDYSKISDDNYTEEFVLDMPFGVTNISGITSVEVKVTLNSVSTDSVTITPDKISVTNTPKGKSASITSKSLRVSICGSPASVEAAKANGISATVDLFGASIGAREYPVNITFGDLRNVWVYIPEGASNPAVNVEIK